MTRVTIGVTDGYQDPSVYHEIVLCLWFRGVFSTVLLIQVTTELAEDSRWVRDRTRLSTRVGKIFRTLIRGKLSWEPSRGIIRVNSVIDVDLLIPRCRGHQPSIPYGVVWAGIVKPSVISGPQGVTISYYGPILILTPGIFFVSLHPVCFISSERRVSVFLFPETRVVNYSQVSIGEQRWLVTVLSLIEIVLVLRHSLSERELSSVGEGNSMGAILSLTRGLQGLSTLGERST